MIQHPPPPYFTSTLYTAEIVTALDNGIIQHFVKYTILFVQKQDKKREPVQTRLPFLAYSNMASLKLAGFLIIRLYLFFRNIAFFKALNFFDAI